MEGDTTDAFKVVYMGQSAFNMLVQVVPEGKTVFGLPVVSSAALPDNLIVIETTSSKIIMIDLEGGQSGKYNPKGR